MHVRYLNLSLTGKTFTETEWYEWDFRGDRRIGFRNHGTWLARWLCIIIAHVYYCVGGRRHICEKCRLIPDVFLGATVRCAPNLFCANYTRPVVSAQFVARDKERPRWLQRLRKLLCNNSNEQSHNWRVIREERGGGGIAQRNYSIRES